MVLTFVPRSACCIRTKVDISELYSITLQSNVQEDVMVKTPTNYFQTPPIFIRPKSSSRAYPSIYERLMQSSECEKATFPELLHCYIRFCSSLNTKENSSLIPPLRVKQVL